MRWFVVVGVALAMAGGCRPDDPYTVTLDLKPWLAKLADDDQHDAAVEFLAGLGDTIAPALTAAMTREAPGVRLGLIEVIDAMPAGSGLNILAQGARDADADVRFEALQSIVHVEADQQAVVEPALQDPVPKVRQAAARACAAHCRSREALGRLVEVALRDQPFANAIWATSSLVAMLPNDDPRSSLARTTIDGLSAAVTPDRPLEERARAALLRNAAELEVKDTAAVRIAATADVDVMLRRHVVYLLDQTATADDVTLLRRLRDDPAVQGYAVEALQRLSAAGVGAATTALADYTGPRPTTRLPPPAQ